MNKDRWTVYINRKKGLIFRQCYLCRRKITEGDKFIFIPFGVACVICAKIELVKRIKKLRKDISKMKQNLKKITDKDLVIKKMS